MPHDVLPVFTPTFPRPARRRASIAAVLGLVLLVAPPVAHAAGPAHPFGSRPLAYAPGAIRPNHVGQDELDRAVRDFYDAWKRRYLLQACGEGRWLVQIRPEGDDDRLTISEAHGFGMLALPLVAGHDPQAKEIFDGMVAYWRDHPSRFTPELLAWSQDRSCRSPEGADSGSDADMDIALGLMLADRQWGSCGAVDYLGLARTLLAAIKRADIHPSGTYVMLGDWAGYSEPYYQNGTRTSDMVPGHWRAFAELTGDPVWNRLIESTYGLVERMQSVYSGGTGLLPDFIRDPLTDPAPAYPYFLEDAYDGSYVYNACRDPLRLSLDFLAHGEPRARTAVARMEEWIRTSTGGVPTAIRSGYEIDGKPLSWSGYVSMAFVATFGAGATVDAANQQWLNAIWDLVVATPVGDEGYYEDTLKLLSMIVMSGNWWMPDLLPSAPCGPVDPPPAVGACSGGVALENARIDLSGLGLPASAQRIRLDGTMRFPDGRIDGRALDAGAQLLLEDLGRGGTPLLDLTTGTSPVPAASDGACGNDGWRTSGVRSTYGNRSGAIDPPACSAGSARGLYHLRLERGAQRAVAATLSARGPLPSSIVGPVRATVVLGKDAAAGAAGRCGSTELSCRTEGRRTTCR